MRDKPSVTLHLKYRTKTRFFHKNIFAKQFFTSSTTPAAVSSIIIYTFHFPAQHRVASYTRLGIEKIDKSRISSRKNWNKIELL